MIHAQVLMAAGDMSQANLLTAPLQTYAGQIACIQAVWGGGTPVGTFVVQISNDGTYYSDYTASVLSVSAAGDYFWNFPVGSPWARLSYTKTSGSGTLYVTGFATGPKETI
jgi:hypothetical protein